MPTKEEVKLTKKVLIVSSWAPPQISGSANFLYNLFSNFETEDYCLLTSKRNFSMDKGANQRILPGKYFFFEDSPVFKIPLFPYTYTKQTRLSTKIYQKIRRGILKIRRACAIIKSGLKIIKSEKINLLLGTSDMGPALLSTFLLSKLTNTPYVLLLFDIYRDNDFSLNWKITARLAERTLLKNASGVITFSKEMRDNYKNHYGEPEKYHTLYQCADISHYERIRASAKNPANNKSKNIVFTGSIYWAQQKSIQNMIQAVDTMADDSIHFLIYTPEPSKEFKELVTKYNIKGKTRILSIPPDDIPSVQCAADILFLPLSWDTACQSMIAIATPFKLGEYLAAERPIIVHSPPGSSLNKYAREEGFGHVVDTEDIEMLQNAISKILSDTMYAKTLVSAARKTFNKNHRISGSVAKLKEVMENTNHS